MVAFTVDAPPVPTAPVPPAAQVNACVEALAALDADAALLHQHVARAVEARTAMHKAQVGQIVSEGEVILTPDAAALGALRHLLSEHRELSKRLRVALVRAYDCEHVRRVRGA